MDRVSLSVGSGGKLMRDFVKEVIVETLGNPYLEQFGDSAHVNLSGDLCFTTDSFVVRPIFFPGGDIGKLAVSGTINDLVVAGARPLFLSLSLIIEEGFFVHDLKNILSSVRATSSSADVLVVTGDTKVVPKGDADQLYINTAGIGQKLVEPGNIREGDVLIVTDCVGDHSVAIMVARGEFDFWGDVQSDCRPLHSLLPLWDMGVKWMRDITRGGLATVLCELAEEKHIPVEVWERDVPFSPAVNALAEILGIDSFYLASEGSAVLVAPQDKTDEIIAFLHGIPEGRHASVIGRIGGKGKPGEVVLETASGGLRYLEPLTGELLPRIC